VSPVPEPEADLALSGKFLAALRPASLAVAGFSVGKLVETIEGSGELGLALRHAAGLQLALLGDPRVRPEEPVIIRIEGGETLMGIPSDQVDVVTAQWASLGVHRDWIAKEAPRHSVFVHTFGMSKYPVTNGEYLQFVLDVPEAQRPSCWAHGVYPVAADNQPVYSVSPDAADAYCVWLSQRLGRRFRLPSEAEWEYAATGGDGRQFPWGETWDAVKANTAECGPLTTTPVGMYVDGYSPFGIADMAGNVEEYVSDNYMPYAGAAVVHDDLIVTHGEQYRVARGGSYARHGDLARCARRHGWYPSDHFAMGFRVAETL
jgi:toxoflavin biosynthesis protein ToxD